MLHAIPLLDLIINWIKILETSDQDDHSNGDSKIYNLMFKILEMLVKNSTKLCVQALKIGLISLVSKWLPMSGKTKSKNSGANNGHSDSNESSELEEFKVGSGGAATTSFHMQRKSSSARKGQHNSTHRNFCERYDHQLSL